MYGSAGAHWVLIRIMTWWKAFVFDFHDSKFHLCASVSGFVRDAHKHHAFTWKADYIGIFKEIIHHLLSLVESFSHFICKRLCVHKKKQVYHEVEH